MYFRFWRRVEEEVHRLRYALAETRREIHAHGKVVFAYGEVVLVFLAQLLTDLYGGLVTVFVAATVEVIEL
jgi:hypothetical protein